MEIESDFSFQLPVVPAYAGYPTMSSLRPAVLSPQPQARSHGGPQITHSFSSSATPITTVHPPTLKQHNGTTSPAAAGAGYFGLVVEPGESTLSLSHAKHNWSPSGLSIKSTAAKSPRPVAMEGLPEPFQKQAQALAFSLHQQCLSNASETGYSSSECSGDNKSSVGPSSPSSYSPSHLSFAEADHSEGEVPLFGQSPKILNKPRTASPFIMEMDRFSRSSDSLARTPALSFPGIAGPSLLQRRQSTKAATLPMTTKDAKDATVTMITPDALASLLRMERDNIMLLDLRTYPQYSLSRLQGAVHLCIPTTLLKRPNYNVSKLLENFANESDRAKFAGWRDTKYIVVYDADSQTGKDAVSASHTVNKFVREGWTGHAYCIKGKLG